MNEFRVELLHIIQAFKDATPLHLSQSHTDEIGIQIRDGGVEGVYKWGGRSIAFRRPKHGLLWVVASSTTKDGGVIFVVNHIYNRFEGQIYTQDISLYLSALYYIGEDNGVTYILGDTGSESHIWKIEQGCISSYCLESEQDILTLKKELHSIWGEKFLYKRPDVPVYHGLLSDFLREYAHFSQIHIPKEIPKEIEIEVDRNRAIYMVKGEEEIHEYTFSNPGMFVGKPEALMLRGQPFIKILVEFGHYSHHYFWFQKQVTYFDSYKLILDNGVGVSILGKRGGCDSVVHWRNGQISMEEFWDGSNKQNTIHSYDNPSVVQRSGKEGYRIFLFGFCTALTLLFSQWYFFANPSLSEWKAMQEIPESKWVSASVVKGSCSVGRNNGSGYSVNGPEGVFRETLKSTLGKSCPDEDIHLEVAPFSTGWISRHKVQNSFPFFELLFTGFLLLMAILFAVGLYLFYNKK